MFKDIAIEELLHTSKTATLIDVRSPKEFADATIPGSVNIPVFTNEERAEVGTIYKQIGKQAAKERGLAIFSAKLPAFIASFQAIDTPMTVFCWRGGMRSKTAATVLDLMGVKATRLRDGVRSYREWVVNTLAKEDFKPELLVLNGYTGSGKTLMLTELKQRGYPVIDLEDMAGHRGSIFGQIGLTPSNQKSFDSQLVNKMIEYQDQPFVFLEGESKRIGKIMLPDFLFIKKEQSKQLFIHVPMEERVLHILDDYQPWKYPVKFSEAFQLIKKRIHTPVAKEIEDDLQAENYHHAVEQLLSYYYDPKYQYTETSYPDEQKQTIKAANVTEAVEKIEAFLAEKQVKLT